MTQVSPWFPRKLKPGARVGGSVAPSSTTGVFPTQLGAEFVQHLRRIIRVEVVGGSAMVRPKGAWLRRRSAALRRQPPQLASGRYPRTEIFMRITLAADPEFLKPRTHLRDRASNPGLQNRRRGPAPGLRHVVSGFRWEKMASRAISGVGRGAGAGDLEVAARYPARHNTCHRPTTDKNGNLRCDQSNLSWNF